MVRVLATDGMAKSAVDELKAKGYEVIEQHYEPDELCEAIKDVDVIVVRSATKVREPIIDAAAEAGRLKMIIRGGVGVDNIDVKYAQDKGIEVRNTPAASSASVAELTLGHMFSLARFIGIANYTMREGKWEKKAYKGTELAGKTLGLIGMGRIARELAKRAEAIGMKIMYFDIFEIPGLPESYVKSTKEDILKEADYVSLHIPMPEDKKPVISAADLASMKPTAYILNLARGGLIDEDDLCDALDNGVIAGAALDVYPSEPATNERVLSNPKISLTPHIGGSTKEAQDRIGGEICKHIYDKFE